MGNSQWTSIVCVAHQLQNAVRHAVDMQSMQKIATVKVSPLSWRLQTFCLGN